MEAIATISNEIKKFSLIEAGGVLLGYEKDDQIYIQIATDGGPKAIHEQFYFQADADYIDLQIDMAYANSSGQTVYIGEWHSHPEVNPDPSKKDLTSLMEIASTADEYTLLLIIGAQGFKASKFEAQSLSLICYSSSLRILEL